MNPVHTLPPCFFKIHFNIVLYLNMVLQEALQPKCCTNFSSFPCILHICACLFFLDLIFLIRFGEGYKLQSTSLYIFLQPHLSLSLLGLNVVLNTLFSNTLNLYSSLNVRDQVLLPYKTTDTVTVLYLK
jgi:hypothetical protein